MRTIITLALFLIVGFAGARGLVSRATHRLPLAGFLATGMEFFVLGLLLGPSGFGFITDTVLTDLEPIIYLALGWVGLLFGVELSWEQVRRISNRIFRALLLDTLVSLVTFAVGAFYLIEVLWPDYPVSGRVIAAIIFGVTAAVNSPTIVALVSQRLPSRGPLTNTLKVASALSALFPLIAFGALFTVINPRFFGNDGIAYGILWWLFVNAVGILLGFLTVLFTHERSSHDEMRLLLIGTLFVVGGICFYLKFSSLYTAMVMGFVVGNLSRRRELIFRELHVVEKTLFVAFLLLVGALVSIPGWQTLLMIAAYVGLRLLTRYFVTGTAVTAGMPDARPFGKGAGLALSGQGVMAMAIALDCFLSFGDPALDRVLTVVAFAVLINDIIGYALTRKTIVAAGEAVTVPRARRPRDDGSGGDVG